MNKYLKPYIPLVHFLGIALGPLVEIVLHDISLPNTSIIAIANNHISGRKVGGPSTDLILRMLNDLKSNKNKTNFVANYSSQTKNNIKCKSSSYFIRDNENNLIGCLCININIGSVIEAQNILNLLINPVTQPNILPSEALNSSSQTDEDKQIFENLHESISDTINTIIDSSTSYNIDLSKLSVTERIKLVGQLNEKGLFHLKGSVPAIAAKFKVSEPTIYRYLSKAKKN